MLHNPPNESLYNKGKVFQSSHKVLRGYIVKKIITWSYSKVPSADLKSNFKAKITIIVYIVGRHLLNGLSMRSKIKIICIKYRDYDYL